MKLTVEKLPNNDVRLELQHAAAKKPLVVVLDPAKQLAVLGILEAARRSQAFKFSVEV